MLAMFWNLLANKPIRVICFYKLATYKTISTQIMDRTLVIEAYWWLICRQVKTTYTFAVFYLFLFIKNNVFSNARQEALASCKELSYVYHRLHQIKLVNSSVEAAHCTGLMLALTAVNLAEAAASVLSSDQKVDIYVAAALRIKYTCPVFLQGANR